MNGRWVIMSTLISDDRSPSSSDKPYAPSERDRTKPYIAIVDDDSAFASYLRTFLSLRGYEVRCYTRGDELLAAMKQAEAPDPPFRPPFERHHETSLPR